MHMEHTLVVGISTRVATNTQFVRYSFTFTGKLQLKWFGNQIYFYKMTALPHDIDN